MCMYMQDRACLRRKSQVDALTETCLSACYERARSNSARVRGQTKANDEVGRVQVHSGTCARTNVSTMLCQCSMFPLTEAVGHTDRRKM
eukprot:3380131-Pleurochrysis_carterae.AAC.5